MSTRFLRLIHPRRWSLPQTRTGRTEAILVLFVVLVPLLGNNRAVLDRFGGYFLLAIFALSVDLIWGYGGMFTFGHAAFFGGGGYVVGMLTTRDAGILPLPLGLAVPIAVCGAGLLALAISYFVFSGPQALRGVEFAVVTLAAAVMAERLADAGGSVTGGQNGILMEARLEIPNLVSLHRGIGFYCLAAALLTITYVILKRFVRSHSGLILRGIRGNEDRVALLGYDVPRLKRRTFVVSGALAAFAGAIYFTQFGIVSPGAVGVSASTLVLLWVVLGGRGTLLGPIAGAIALPHLTNTLSSGGLLDVWLVIVGAILVGVILLLPNGVFGYLGAEQ